MKRNKKKYNIYKILFFIFIIVIFFVIKNLFITSNNVFKTISYYFNTNEKFFNKQAKIHNYYLTNKIEHNNLDGVNLYYINLDKSFERKKYIEEQFNKYKGNGSVKLVRVPGVVGKDLNMKEGEINVSPVDQKQILKYKYDTSFPTNMFILSHNELGCLLSHIKAIYFSYINGDKYSIILEDDASFFLTPLWCKSINQIVNDAPKDWNIIHLRPRYIYDNEFSDTKTLNPVLNGCLAYLINRKGMENIIGNVQNNVFKLPFFSKPVADYYMYAFGGKSYYYKYGLFVSQNVGNGMNSQIRKSNKVDTNCPFDLFTLDYFIDKYKIL
jgi:GR25 family glycosyltransferase involved in LPS biosynthesis